jgi:hypothetical protein
MVNSIEITCAEMNGVAQDVALETRRLHRPQAARAMNQGIEQHDAHQRA